MVALPQFSNVGWFLEDPIGLEKQEKENNSYFCGGKNEDSYFVEDHFLHDSSQVLMKNGDYFEGFGDGLIQEGGGGGITTDNKLVKKLNHNACERDRRKKINTLYHTLRSLLPDEDQSKKLSIPATVSRVLKYIPELQKHVERLHEKKQNLLTRISKQANSIIDERGAKAVHRSVSSWVVSATRISDREIICQISMPKLEKGSFSKVLLNLEQEGFLVLNTSRFESSEGRIFYNMHLQGPQGSLYMDAEILKEKLLSIYEKGGEIVF